MPKRSSTDLNQTAFNIVQQSTGQAAPVPAKNPAAVALGRLGGLKGGNARAANLSAKKRREIAIKAANSRWAKKPKSELTLFLIGIISGHSIWQIEPTTGWERDQKHYGKKHPSELAAVMRNLERFMLILKVSKNSKCVQAGYLHTESMGILALDQKGGGANLQETRLYIFAMI